MPEEIARDAREVREVGAGNIHVHPRDEHGAESLDAVHVSAMVRAVRAASPGLAIGVSTAAWIEPDLERRLLAISGWTDLPDFASVNLSEPGALRVIDLLLERDIAVEPGVWNENDARMFIENGLDAACLRVLVEVDAEPDAVAAVRLAASIDALLDDALREAPRLHHGGGEATWTVLREAIANGHDVRVGLEDTLIGPDGAAAAGNRALLEALVAMARGAGRAVEPR